MAKALKLKIILDGHNKLKELLSKASKQLVELENTLQEISNLEITAKTKIDGADDSEQEME